MLYPDGVLPTLFALARMMRPKAIFFVALTLATVTGLPGVAFCCGPESPCCPMDQAPPDDTRQSVAAPLPDCCERIVPGPGAPSCERPSRSPAAPQLAVVPSAVAPVVSLIPQLRPALPTVDPPTSPPSRPASARAPPRS